MHRYMSDQATRKDVDEVIEIIKDFMAQSALEIQAVNKKLDGVNNKGSSPEKL